MLARGERVLVVVAHRDDETLGAGGTIARLRREGAEVAVVWLAEPLVSRSTADPVQATIQADLAGRILGASPISLVLPLLPDNRFDCHGVLAAALLVEEAIGTYRPDTVITHYGCDLNVDHCLTHDAVLIATRPFVAQRHRVQRVLACEVLSSTEVAFGHPAFAPTVFVRLTAADLRAKQRALACYETEVGTFPHPRSVKAVAALAALRGVQCGHEQAEAFLLLREVA